MNDYELMKVIEHQQQQINALTNHAQQTSAYLGGEYAGRVGGSINAEIERGIESHAMPLSAGQREAVSSLVSRTIETNPQLASKIASGDTREIAKLAQDAAAKVRPVSDGSAYAGRSGDRMSESEASWDDAALGFARSVAKARG